MSLYPDVQREAQAKIDAVVGRDRLPTFEDLERLPFVQAVFKELLRWQPVLPLGVLLRLLQYKVYQTDLSTPAAPHLLTRDDEYRGYYIPKGTLVIGNAW